MELINEIFYKSHEVHGEINRKSRRINFSNTDIHNIGGRGLQVLPVNI